MWTVIICLLCFAAGGFLGAILMAVLTAGTFNDLHDTLAALREDYRDLLAGAVPIRRGESGIRPPQEGA